MNLVNLALLVAVLLLAALYMPLNVPREPLHNVKLPLDDAIPLVPVFVIPYVSLYLFLGITFIALSSGGDRLGLRITLVAIILTVVVSYLVFLLFQTYVDRPVITQDDMLSRLVAGLYLQDRPYNAFPSLHTSLSTLSAISWVRGKGRLRLWMAAWATLIVVSTIFVKQHYLVDLTGGLILAASSYWVAYYVLTGRRKRAAEGA